MNDKLENFLVAKGETQKLLKKYLVENTSDIIAEKILNGKKTMNGCYNYVLAEARKQAQNGVTVISDPETYGMAEEYFNDDKLDFEKKKTAAKVIPPKPKEVKELKEEEVESQEPKEEPKKVEIRKVTLKRRNIEDMKPDEALEYVIQNKKPKKTKKEIQPENQVSMFDLM